MASGNKSMEAHPAAAVPPPIAAPPQPPAAAVPPPIAAPPQPPVPPAGAVAIPAVRSPNLARFAFLVVAALVSASWYVEQFAAAAADLRVPWPAVVATLVFFSAFFCASVYLFGSFFLRPPPPAAVAAAQWKGVGAGAGATVAVGIAACLVAAGGSAYGYAPARC